jgi:hypothetical protein
MEGKLNLGAKRLRWLHPPALVIRLRLTLLQKKLPPSSLTMGKNLSSLANRLKAPPIDLELDVGTGGSREQVHRLDLRLTMCSSAPVCVRLALPVMMRLEQSSVSLNDITF